MRTIPGRALMFALLATPIGTAALVADEGRIPIFQPTTITQPGHYVLTRDIAVASGDVIVIQAGNVTLDLNGHTISSQVTTPGSDDRLVRIASTVTGDVTIRGGRLSGGAFGIFYHIATGAAPTLGVRIENVDVANVGNLGIGAVGVLRAEVISCRVLGGRDHGIVADTFGTYAVLNNHVKGVGARGIYVVGVGIVRGNVVDGFQLARTPGASGDGGIFVAGEVGRSASGTIVEGNAIHGGTAGNPAIQLINTSHALVAKNDVSGNSGVGISIEAFACPVCLPANGNRITENLVSGNGEDGIRVQGLANVLDGNQVEGNGGCGVNFLTAGGHAYRGNLLRGNTGGSVCGAANTDAGGNIL